MKALNAGRMLEWTVDYGVRPGAIAFFFVLVAFLWTLLFQHVIAYPFLFLFFGAVMGSAWFGGIIAGFASVALSSIIIIYFLVPPLFSMTVAGPSQSYIAAFILCATAITLVSSTRKRSEAAVRAARDQLETKVQERTAELLKSNLEIQKSEQMLRSLSEAIPQQIWRAGPTGSIEFCNQHLIDYCGCSADRLRGEDFFSIFHPVDEPAIRRIWANSIAADREFEVEARIRGRDTVYRWFLVRGIPQQSTEGNVTQWYGIHIDIEQSRQAIRGLVVAQDELARQSRTMSMGEMAASIAHELNQPLTAVMTHAYACREWLRAEPANLARATDTADKIVQESTRASAVVARVRALFRNEPRFRESVDLNLLIQDLARLLREEAVLLDISIKLQLDENLPKVEIDSVQIQQAILNLATNGMDAMIDSQPPRELVISTGLQSPGTVLVSVEDSGAGLTAEARAKMFEPFFSTKPQGTGMGLAICRSIVEAHEGRIWASDRQAGGTVFQFTMRANGRQGGEA